MEASQTVPEHLQRCNSVPISPRHGVVTLFGYGTNICVDRGHLTIEDGIGKQRRYTRFPRVGHGLRRLVVIGSDGMISFAAIRWLADQDAAFVMLERDGKVLATTGPVRSSDARLRRAQAFAVDSGAAILITKELISQKLRGQEQVAREKLGDFEVADKIAEIRLDAESANTVLRIRQSESQAAKAYWQAWRNVQVSYPRTDLRRVPEHWKRFGTRESLLTNSPRLAVNPPNAILNYLYAILESEARLAATALGLDPGLGVLHFDSRTRDSLACDLMEPVRPKVDGYLLDWLCRSPMRRDWFFEQQNGNCRLMGEFAEQLSQTALTWRGIVAPYAERCARILWSTVPKAFDKRFQATPLTQSRRREAKGNSELDSDSAPQSPVICGLCGKPTRRKTKFCAGCTPAISREQLIRAAEKGRIAAQTPRALARLAAKQRSHRLAELAWNPRDQPKWLDKATYLTQIQPCLESVTVATIALAMNISIPYASNVRAGQRVPHPRHWLTLAKLVARSRE